MIVSYVYSKKKVYFPLFRNIPSEYDSAYPIKKKIYTNRLKKRNVSFFEDGTFRFGDYKLSVDCSVFLIWRVAPVTASTLLFSVPCAIAKHDDSASKAISNTGFI